MSARARQIPFDLPHRSAFGREDFLVSPSNETAVAWLDRWPDWPNNGLVLHGPPGSGKTHLVHVWRAMSGAAIVDAGDVGTADLDEPAIAIEDLDGLADEVALFHLLNRMRERGGHIMLTATAAPAHLTIKLPDLRSRLQALPAVAIGAPDDALLAAVYVKLFSDRQVKVNADVIGYLVTHVERSMEAAGKAVAAIDRAALESHRAITVALIRGVLNPTS
jgi:chromosomal replication initiation ATPase DnaA